MPRVSRAEVVEVYSCGEDVREFILQVDEFENFEPGQFLQLTLQETTASANWPDSRTFSIASHLNNKKQIRLVIKRVGYFTSRIFEQLVPGKICFIKYAYGDFLLPMFDENERIHCIAGGTGIAPFLSFIECLAEGSNSQRLFLYYSARTRCEFVAKDYIETTLGSNANFYCTREVVDGVNSRYIEVDDILGNVINIRDEHFYICGSSAFISFFAAELRTKGVENIYTDEWS